MLRKIGTVVVALGVMWFAFFLLSNVDTRDVVAYNDIDKHVGSQPFTAGDLVAVSADGLSPSLICAPQIGSGGLRETTVAKAYVNGLGQSLPQFTQLVGWAADLVGVENTPPGTATEGVALRFTGRISTFPAAGATPSMSRACACDVAAALLRREQVCMVERSLIEARLSGPDAQGLMTSHERTVGITFRKHNVLFTAADVTALNCPGLSTANDKLELQTGACAAGSGTAYDVALRHVLGVIREEDL